MKIILILIWLVPISGAALGGLVLVTGMATATGAPQETVIAALACACAILLYCFARAVSEIINAIREPRKEREDESIKIF